MKLKRVFSILLSLMLLLSLSGVVVAGSVTHDSDLKFVATSVVFVHDKETYIISIPDTITLGEKDVAVESEIAATAVVLDEGHCLNVTAQSTNEWKVAIKDGNEYDLETSITYAFHYNKNNAASLVLAEGVAPIEIMHISAGTATMTTPITFTRTSTAPTTGSYYDVLTFTVNVNDEHTS